MATTTKLSQWLDNDTLVADENHIISSTCATAADVSSAKDAAITAAEKYADDILASALGDVGVDLTAYIKWSEVGEYLSDRMCGVATLDEDGKVPSDQLPSYVDDVLEYDSYGALPAEGEKDKIYVTTDDNKIYRWSGSTYIEINSSVSTADHAASADSATTAEKLGTSSVGSGTNPIYLNSGVATASTATVGSATKPAYLNAGTLTECGASLDVDITGKAANADHATSADTATAATSLNCGDAGDGTNLIYFNGGQPTESKETVGSTSVPVYLSKGRLTQATAVPTSSDISDALTTAQSYADSAAETSLASANIYTDNAVGSIVIPTITDAYIDTDGYLVLVYA